MRATPSTGFAERQRALALPRPRWDTLALVGVLGLGLALRLIRYADAPGFTDNADELQFTWAGLGLIKSGDPYTWTYFPGYASYTQYHAFGTTYPLVHHWLDHPPLFSYLMGGWVWLLGDRTLDSVTAAQVRIVPIFLSTLTIVLVFLLARRLLGWAPALLAAALLATSPGAILLGREVEPEALQAVLLLAGLLLTLRLLEGDGGRWAAAGLLLCAVAAPLAKVSGVAVGGICAVALAADGRWRLAASLLGAVVAGLLLFVVYGALLDWRLFVHVWGLWVGNRSGVMAGYDFIAAMAGVNRRLRDGWWLLGWIGIGLLGATGDRRRQLLLVWPPAAYAATMLVLAREQSVEQYGWYRQIVYPEVYLGAAFLAMEAVRRRSVGLLTLLLVLGGATATEWWLAGPDYAWVPDAVSLVLLILAVLGPAVLSTWRRRDSELRLLARGLAALALALMLLGNAVESFWLDRIFTRL